MKLIKIRDKNSVWHTNDPVMREFRVRVYCTEYVLRGPKSSETISVVCKTSNGKYIYFGDEFDSEEDAQAYLDAYMERL